MRPEKSRVRTPSIPEGQVGFLPKKSGVPLLGCFLLPKSLTFSGLMESPSVGSLEYPEFNAWQKPYCLDLCFAKSASCSHGSNWGNWGRLFFHVDPGLINPCLLMGVPGFSGDLSLLEGNTPILINRGILIRAQHCDVRFAKSVSGRSHLSASWLGLVVWWLTRSFLNLGKKTTR